MSQPVNRCLAPADRQRKTATKGVLLIASPRVFAVLDTIQPRGNRTLAKTRGRTRSRSESKKSQPPRPGAL